MIVTPNRNLLPRTGQKTSYATGDDGWFEAGWPGTTRFVDNLNGTISDRATGLMWVQDPAIIIPGGPIGAVSQVQVAAGTWASDHGAYAVGDLAQGDVDPGALFYVCIAAHTAAGDKEPPNASYWVVTPWTASAANLTTPATFAWANAINYALGSDWDADNDGGAVGLSYAGFTNWRLPNMDELFSLVDHCRAAPFIDPLFTNVPTASNGYYWSSTTPSATANACATSFRTFGISQNAAKGGTYYARPVRGGIVNG